MHRFRFALVVRPGSSVLFALWAALSVTAPVAAQDAGTLPGAATPVQRLPSAEARQKSAACTAGCHQDLKAVEHPAHKELACTQCHANVTDGQVKHERALDELPPEKTCTGCHPDETRRQTSGLHKDLLCENCHGSAHGAFKRDDSSTCKRCHGDQVTAANASIHGTTEKQRVRCMDCHGDLHAPKAHKDPTAPMSKVLQVTTCGECHDTEHVRAFRTSVHGQGLLRSGLAVAPTCSTCHGAHDIAKVKSETSKVAKVNSVETCGQCHEFIVSRWKESTHGQKWLADKDPARVKPGAEPQTPAAERPKKYPVCVDCHSGHETFDPMVYANNLKMADTCGACHEEASRTYRESFHGKATRLGQAAAATCADCHTPHYMLPATDPRSTVQPKNLAATCGRCHAGASGEFLKFDVHADPDSKARNAKVYWIYKFMTLLLFGVMGFFGVHALLWLQRALVAAWRHELPESEKPGEPWVRRFRPIHIGIHVAIVLTFLTLGATGLPLKFSGQGWARPIESLFGGPAANQLLHRIAGVLTFGYAAVFLAYLLYEALVKRTKGLFWGWASMTPRWKDLQDLWANFKWFCYRGKPPHLDRWAYWEKFDFFAVFWGVPMIGISGLMLWAPMWFTKFLPGWALNVAYVIHSDEALLATGFIFFFHFFHTHLRPEAFPMDPVMFLGGMPLSRFEHERPEEYARAVKDGTLDKLLMQPPSDRARRRANIFGAVTLAIGVILALLLFVTGIRAL